MIYTVECSFVDPAEEAEWNAFYSLEKLPALISVSGFQTSQRFKALSADCPRYLAIHSIDNLNILQGDEYRQKGGGNFARWQRHITDWRRNLYGGINRAPAISKDEYLVESAVGPGRLIEMGLTPYQMQAVALEKLPEHRWLAKLARPIDLSLEGLPQGVHLYVPMTEQLTSSGDAASLASR
ncbi:sugar ABC transporter [Affinibrenneria salicis]|uniref:Sugar ABC transporter n=1 Tax=Affinibrenneria salicis TaxID=2590031 RepID=A0A5J5FUK1_9GAMM|nr:sugar ABC transporter [Affinibrenneria salicis]KAA8996686.1 sugar ABC transporter [Affinibrenneria salicis]